MKFGRKRSVPSRPTTEGIVRPDPNLIDLRPDAQKSRQRRPSKPEPNWRLMLAGLLIVLLLAGGFLVYKKLSSQERTFHNQEVSFNYPKTYTEQPANPAAGASIIGILSQAKPESVITVRKEKDADKGAQAAKRSVLDDLELGASRTLPLSHPGFQKDGDERIKINGSDAADFSFHYTGKDNQTAVYVHFLIVPRGHDAYYLIVETPDKKVADHDAEKIRSSLKLP